MTDSTDIRSISEHFFEKSQETAGSFLEIFYLDMAIYTATNSMEISKIHKVVLQKNNKELKNSSTKKVVFLGNSPEEENNSIALPGEQATDHK